MTNKAKAATRYFRIRKSPHTAHSRFPEEK
jgi:hypothetical protein